MDYYLEVWGSAFGGLEVKEGKTGNLFSDIVALANEFPMKSIFVETADREVLVCSIYKDSAGTLNVAA